MARPIWTGTISFGLLNVPVQLYSAERNVDLHFRLLDSRDKRPIRYERVNADTGEEVPWKDVVKAFEYAKGNYVVMDEEEIRKAAPEATQTVEIEAFVDQQLIDPMLYERPYYLVPAKKAEKGYVLLREALKRSGKVGIARVVIRTRQYLAALIPVERALILNLLRFPQELVAADDFQLPAMGLERYRIAPREMKMAEQLLHSMTVKWRHDDYADEFRKKLQRIIQTRVAKSGKKVKVAEEKEQPLENATTNVVDFMSLLQKSLAHKSPAKKAASAPARKDAHRRVAATRSRRR